VLRIAALLVVTSLSACRCGYEPRPDVPPFPDCGIAAQGQALLYIPPGIQLRLDDGTTCTPGIGEQCVDEFALCDLDVGEVAVGSVARRGVDIVSTQSFALQIYDVHIEGDCADVYLEGSSNDAPTLSDAPFPLSVVVSPTAVGSCRALLVVESDAGNAERNERGTTVIAIDVVAERIAGGDEGCTADVACCCAIGTTTAPQCVDDRLTCDSGALFFDDRCDEPQCAPAA
jgi:hypothetical protein